MSQVCRTCLKVIENASQLFSLDTIEPVIGAVHIKTKLQACVPEIVLNRVKNSVICIYCLGALNAAYDFKRVCLQSEIKISEYMTREMIDSIDLNKFIINPNSYGYAIPFIPQLQFPQFALLNFNINQPNPSLMRYVTTNDANVFHRPSEGNIKCPTCQECFASDDLLKQHMSCHVEANLKCNQCDFFSNSQQQLEEHMKCHSSVTDNQQGVPAASNNLENNNRCLDYDYSIVNNRLYIFRRLPTGERLYCCNFCNYQSIYSTYLQNHLNVHTSETLYRCPACQLAVLDQTRLKVHMQIHMQEQSFKCTQCPYTATLEVNLRRHVTRVHSKKNVPNSSNVINSPPGPPETSQSETPLQLKHFKCTDCFYSTEKLSNLKQHIFRNHITSRVNSSDVVTDVPDIVATTATVPIPEQQLFKCIECSYATVDRSNLRRHLIHVHANKPLNSSNAIAETPMFCDTEEERPFKCTECSYAATKRCNLRKHVRRRHINKLLKSPNIINGVTEVTQDTNVQEADPYQISIDEIHKILRQTELDEMSNVENVSNLEDSSSADANVEDTSNVTLDNIEPEIIDDVTSYLITVEEIREVLQNSTLEEFGATTGDQNDEILNNVDIDEIVRLKDMNISKRPLVFRCPVCQEPFKFKHLLNRHLSVHNPNHNKPRIPYKCNECDFTTVLKSQFKVHIHMHTGGKIYSCDKCKYTTIYWSYMLKHKKVHLGERLFKCPYCNYRSFQQAILKQHMNLHTEHRLYSCNECPYVADSELVLQSHMEMHAIGNNFTNSEAIAEPCDAT